MDDGRQVMDGKSSHCLWQGELKKKRKQTNKRKYIFNNLEEKKNKNLTSVFMNNSMAGFEKIRYP